MTLKDILIAGKLTISEGGGGGGGMKAAITIECNDGGFEKGYNPVTDETEYYTYSELMALYEQSGGHLIGCWNDTAYNYFSPMSLIYDDDGTIKWKSLFFDALMLGGYVIANLVELTLYDTDEVQCSWQRYRLSATIVEDN